MNPGKDKDERRAALIRVRDVVEHYEQHSASGADLMRGVRYDLAVRAVDVNGESCLFPACGCAKAECENQPPRLPTVEWRGPVAGWKLS
ncbi:hypothetical protein [Azospirillum sp. SYSU D00513]|uniref:hypothetical protein n=1 Tax=Azospirillum sp. SYSU D00513 TaxID=2812561 RepID=UPI001A95DF57|nr:hypothetical protein [Azospirillum sp. SYSU D00513]